MAEAGALFNKFQQLWQAGKNARLNMECHSGQAWVSLHVHLPHPPHPPTVYHQHPRRHGPSRLLRRARREAARRTTTAEQAVVGSSAVAEPLETTKTSEKTVQILLKKQLRTNLQLKITKKSQLKI